MAQQSQEPPKKKGSKRGAAALFIPAGLFIGMGIGFLINNLVPALFIGLGAGFIIFGLTAMFARD